MYKVENKSIEISNLKTKNRILNNYLDWVIYAMLPSTISNALFPKFTQYGLTAISMERAYVQVNTPQVITDTSTTMAYAKRSLGPIIETISETLGTKSKMFSVAYQFLTPFGSDGDTLEGLGFGRADNTTPYFKVTDFLLAYVDIEPSQIIYNSTHEYGAVRIDEISTDETIITGDYGYLPGQYNGVLQSISMCYTDDGSDPSKEYPVSALTFAVAGVGNVSVTGFDDFYYEDDILYPKTDLYPSTTLYPTQPTSQIRSVRFKYIGNDPSATVYETYIAIKDLDVTYNGTDMSINLVCERG